jgi:hypothetical protein
MEIVLNLAWVFLTVAMTGLWLRFGAGEVVDRRIQVVALLLLLLVLFPVISVSDDLLALQCPAEADCCVRRDHIVVSAHSVLHPVAELVQALAASLPFSTFRPTAPGEIRSHSEDNPSLAAIQNRPPPAA